jgi:O-methyltransferase
LDIRDAYLRLLKRALCDLLGPATYSAVPKPGGTVVAELLPRDQLERREVGADWPMNATTMVGMRRLDQLQECIEAIIRDEVEGDLIETGVWRGGASIFMRAALLAFGGGERAVWLADSFEGLPASRPELFPADAGHDEHFEFEFLAASEDDVRGAFERYGLLDEKVRFLPGWFKDTLPPLTGRRPWSLLRLDGDMYESTIVALESLYPDLSPGGFVVIDDYGAVPQCRQAVEDFRAAQGIEEELRTIDWTGAFWRRGL